jgi:hypothetical protein
MTVRLYGATSGYVDLDAPAVAGSASVTLPGSGTLALSSQLKVLQVVHATYSTQVNITAVTHTDTGLTGTITPSSSASKVLVMVNQDYNIQRANNDVGMSVQLLRGSTVVFAPDGNAFAGAYIGAAVGPASTLYLMGIHVMQYLDSPATTSAVTYKTQGRVFQNTNSGQVQFQESNSTSSMILMEIAA